MNEDERKLLIALARWIAKKEQDEVDRHDLNTLYLNELRRLINAVDGTPAAEPHQRPEGPQLLLAKRR